MARQAHHDDEPPRSTDALWERVRGLGTDLTSLAEATASQFRDLRSDVSSQNAAIVSSVDKLANKLDSSQVAAAERSRPQYLALFGGVLSAIATSVVIIQVLAGLHDKPVDDKLATITQQIGDLTRNTTAAFGEAAKNSVSETEFKAAVDYRDKLTTMQNEMRNSVRQQMQRDIDDLSTQQRRTADQVVTRRELELHWQGQDKADDELRMSIQSLGKRLDELAPPGDTIKLLGQHQHELELKVFGAPR